MRVLGVSGSIRRGSFNRRLLMAAAAELPGAATLDLSFRIDRIPPYDEDAPAPEPVRAMRAAIAAADAVLIATPEYNSSVPGQLKNALDWASRPFPANALRHKPVAVVGASTGMFGAIWAQAELRKVLRTTGAEVIDDELAVGWAHDAFAPDNTLADPQQRAALAALLERLLVATGAVCRA